MAIDERLKDLDDTINDLITWRKDKELNYKERLAVTDRLLKALAMKYKNSTSDRGGKFTTPPGDKK